MKVIGCILVLVLFSCRKELSVIDSTSISVDIERNIFEDSLYKITSFNLISTNDSIIRDARIKILDEDNQNIIIDAEWRNMRQIDFALPERKNYELKIIAYRNINGLEIEEFSEIKRLNNRKVPKRFQLKSASINESILEVIAPYGIDEGISSAYSVIIWGEFTNDFTFDTDGAEDYVFYRKLHSPRRLEFTFSNVYFDTKKIIENEVKWMDYEIRFYYPIAYLPSGNLTTQFRTISFFVDAEQLFNSDDVNPGITYSIENDPDFTSSGADYNGVINIEWLYEN